MNWHLLNLKLTTEQLELATKQSVLITMTAWVTIVVIRVIAKLK